MSCLNLDKREPKLLYVGNIWIFPYQSVSEVEKELEELFSEFGPVKKISVPQPKKWSHHLTQTFGFLEYFNMEDAEACLVEESLYFQRRQLKINWTTFDENSNALQEEAVAPGGYRGDDNGDQEFDDWLHMQRESAVKIQARSDPPLPLHVRGRGKMIKDKFDSVKNALNDGRSKVPVQMDLLDKVSALEQRVKALEIENASLVEKSFSFPGNEETSFEVKAERLLEEGDLIFCSYESRLNERFTIINEFARQYLQFLTISESKSSEVICFNEEIMWKMARNLEAKAREFFKLAKESNLNQYANKIQIAIEKLEEEMEKSLGNHASNSEVIDKLKDYQKRTQISLENVQEIEEVCQEISATRPFEQFDIIPNEIEARSVDPTKEDNLSDINTFSDDERFLPPSSW